MKARDVQVMLRKMRKKEKAALLQRFFKTGPGEYAEGDIFLGVMVPGIRAVVTRCSGLPLKETERLLCSKYHEERFAALLILVARFTKGDAALRRKIYDIYTGNTRYINNWDLIDLTAGHIVGAYLDGRGKEPLTNYAASPVLWERRIAIIATSYYIRGGRLGETFRISRLLLNDREDLIHKAVGWMLREAGKRDMNAEERFLKRHYRRMPRTMLRYAIERFPEERRRAYLDGKV